ncbi:uncharacterized protein LOC143894503 isoform X1 [Temnothorax americanus]|uniref:uncharacterized protein LOC143894503 isoform X1 n=1 Tax=Temnothorax americanus TaxID=1964332 RepID=UPI0040691B47
MKGIYLVTILYVATLSVVAINKSPVADILTECPKTNPENKTVFIPHETDCTKFYSCHVGNKGEPIDCPVMDKNGNRLHFNPKLQVCDWPWRAGCELSSSTPTTTSSTTPSTTTPTPTTPSTTTPTPTTPSTTTPTPTTPSPTTPPTITTQSTPTSTIPSSSSPTTPSLDSCESDNRTHMIPDKTTCDHYYLCYNGEVNPIPQKCDRNLLFNPVLRVCDYPVNVNCSNIPSSTDTVRSTTSSLTSTNPSTSPLFSPMPTKSIDPSAWVCVPNGKRYKVPHETICNYYYWCVNGIKGTHPIKCESYFLFNPVIGQCDYPENVDCNDRSTPSPTTPTTKSTTESTTGTTTETTTETTTKTTTEPTTTRDPNKPRTKCPPKGSTEKARIPHPCLCNVYYECVNGDKILETCSFGMHFDYVREVCDWAAIVKCTRPLPPFDIPIDNYNININDYNTNSICAPEGRAFQHDTDCSAYYLCSNGEKILRHCMEGLHFNVTIQTCDYPQKSCDLNRSPPITDLNTCPPAGSFIETVFLSHECECTQYYQCIDEKRVLRSCPSGLHFDSVRQICNEPTEVKCVDYTISTTPRTISTTISTTKAIGKPRITCPPKGSSESARFPHSCLCNQYYECVEGDKILRTCPIGKYFDDAKEVCNSAAKMKCQPHPSYNYLIDDYDTECSPDGRAFQHEISCTEYYLCYKGEKILKSCEEGLHFNVSLQTCDYPQKKGCDLIFSPMPTIALGICPPADSVEKVLLPHNCDCTQYYECVDGEQVLRDCSGGLHYDHVRQICNEPTEAKCTNLVPTPTVPTKRPSGTPRSDLKCYDEDNKMPYKYDCRFYYKCSNGKMILKTCPRNLYFNPKLRVCDFPENVACDAGSENVPTIPTSTKCHSMTGTTKIPHETDCNLYYVCENGISALKKCHSPELVFNPILKVCDFPENYICNDKMITQNLDPTACIGTCPEEAKYPVLLPNDDCKKFCLCSGGVAWIQSCPEPLYFDSVDKVCKRKNKAVCGKREFSQDDAFTIHNIANEDKSPQLLSKKNTEEHGTHNNLWSELNFYNLDPATCIGTCPEEDPEFAVLLPNDDCKKFCLCSGGVAWVQSCPEPLYFDSVDEVCKRKNKAVCGKREFSQDDAFTIHNIANDDKSPQLLSKKNTEEHGTHINLWSELDFYNLDPATCIGTCPKEPKYPVLLPNDNCKKFCLCSGGVAWVQSCPEPLYFDSVDKVCKRKNKAVCGKREFSQDDAFTIHNIANEDKPPQLLSKKNTEEHGTHNNLWSELDFYNLDPATCIGTCPEEDPEFAVLLPNDDCKKFCLCSGGVAWVQSCPEPLYFDSVDEVCKRKNKAVCGKREFSQDDAFTIHNIANDDKSPQLLSQKNTEKHGTHNNLWSTLHFYNLDPATCIGTCPEEDPEFAVLLPNDDCKKFCLCSGGVAWVQSCPEPLYFDSVDEVCKRKNKAVCGKREFSQDDAFTIHNIANDDKSPQLLSQKNTEEHGTHNNLWSTLHFYNLDPATCIGTCPEEDPEFAVLLPNDDCKKFCMCSGGVAWVQSCPEPLYFDSVDEVCKRKNKARCAKRPFN